MTLLDRPALEVSHEEATYAAVGAFVDELVRAGACRFCVCPGSRSTPLAVAIAGHPGARLWMHLDERSAAFFALGLARATGEPAVLVCTSGTAAANFLPAVVEARYARVPLVVLTADRPPELRDRGAPQAIDQLNLYGAHVKWWIDLPVPGGGAGEAREMRFLAARAVATALGSPAGPVHLNCPFREPLMPPPGWNAAARPSLDAPPSLAVVEGPRVAPDSQTVRSLAATLRAAPRGLLVCGPQNDPRLPGAVASLARATGYPVLADALSGVRCGTHDLAFVVDAYDAFLRDGRFVAEHRPEVVVRLGAMPTSKPLLQFMERHRGCPHILVDGDGGWLDPAGLATALVHLDAVTLCEKLTAALPAAGQEGQDTSGWLGSWRQANRVTRAAIAARLDVLDEPFEGKVFAELATVLPAGATLFAGNSMPVRDLDTFFPALARPLRIMANRGANGIDGVVSTALGAAAASAGPLVLVIGDLSFYHDSNGLLAARRHGLAATIVLLNNDGGGIFSFLPQAAQPEHFETLFGTPHGLDFRPLAETYGAAYTRAEDWPAFRRSVEQSIAAPGLQVVEVRTARDSNVTLHRATWQAVSAALRSAGL